MIIKLPTPCTLLLIPGFCCSPGEAGGAARKAAVCEEVRETELGVAEGGEAVK